MLRLNLEYEVLEPRILFAADQTSQATEASGASSEATPVAVASETHDSAPVDAPPPPPPPATSDIVFVSDAVEGYQTLVSAYSNDHEVIVLNHTSDNLAQMASALEGRHDLSAIHVISHGRSGDIALGTVYLTTGNIGQYSGVLSKIGSALSSDGDILFYGCNVADTSDGQALVEKIASFTAADIAASTNETSVPGDTTLEFATGPIDVSALNLAATGWRGSLVATGFTSSEIDGDTIWKSLLVGSNYDPNDDTQSNTTDVDLLGNASNPMLYTAFKDNASGDDFLAYRFRIDGKTNTSWTSAVLIGLDGNNDAKLDVFIVADSTSPQGVDLAVYDAGSSSNTSPSTTSIAGSPRYTAAAGTDFSLKQTGGDIDANGTKDQFVSFQINFTWVINAFSAQSITVDKDTVFNYVVLSSQQTNSINGDFGGINDKTADYTKTYAQLGILQSGSLSNSPPTAVNDTGSVNEDSTLNVAAGSGVLSNDTDPEANTLTVTGVRTGAESASGTSGTVGSSLSGTYGSLTLNSDGSYSYVADNANSLAAGVTVTEKFTYTISDGKGGTDTAEITFTVTGVNDAPVAQDDSGTVNTNQTLSKTAGAGVLSNDSDPDSGDTLTVTGIRTNDKNTSGTAGTVGTALAGLYGTLTINSNGSYSYVSGAASGTDYFTYTVSDGTVSQTATLAIQVSGADNRALGVNSISVNEASPYAVFTVTGALNQNVVLSLSSSGAGSAILGTDTSNAGNSVALQYYDSAQGWVDYVDGSTIAMPSTAMLVRTRIVNDNTYEGPETFVLTATNGAGTGYNGTATIYDDGRGDIYPNNTSGNTDGTAAKNDDRPTITVAGLSDVSEGSTAVYTVTLDKALSASTVIDLALGAVGDGATSDTDYNATYTAFYYVGATKTSLTVTGNQITLPANVTTFYVAAATTSDNVFEGSESVTLSAGFNAAALKYANGVSGTLRTGASGTGASAIVDDGTGKVYDGNVGQNGPTSSGPADDDRPMITVAGLSDVSEGSTAVYTVTLNKALAAGAVIDLSLGAVGDGATSGTDYNATYTAFYYVGATKTSLTVTGNQITLPANVTTFYVAAATTSDNVFEGSESVTLSAGFNAAALKYANGVSGTLRTGASGTGASVIVDDGTGKVYDGNVGPSGPTSSGPADDDRPLSVSGSTISESSPYAVFEVTAAAGDTLTLALSSGTASVGTDTGTALQYFNGSSWQPYSGSVVVPNNGRLLVRVAIVADGNLEGPETFSLVATRGGSSASGTTTIVDNGTNGNVFLAGNNTATPTAGVADDDTPPAPIQQPPAPPPVAPPARPAPVPALAAAPISATVQNLATTPATPVAATPVIAPAPLAPVALRIPAFGGLIADRPEFNGGNFKVNVVSTEASPGTTFSATLPDGSPLPPGVTIDASTGQISGLKPQDMNDLTVRILATSSEGSRTLEIKIEFPDQRGALEDRQEFATLEDLARLSLDQPFKTGTFIPAGHSSAPSSSTGLPSFSQRLQELVLNSATGA